MKQWYKRCETKCNNSYKVLIFFNVSANKNNLIANKVIYTVQHYSDKLQTKYIILYSVY